MTQEQTFIDFAEWSDGADIFYRPQDKMEFQRSLKAVVNDHLGLAVVADSEKILNHYCRLMISRLRGMQEFQLEVLLPSDTDTLLKRFNQIMASMPIDRALRPPDADTPVTLMVLNDAHLVGEEQWLLLSQLLSDFPGVNVRMILFVDVTEWPRYEKPLKLFGRKLHQWKLEAPTSLESKDLLAAARQNGFKVEVDSLLRGLAIDIPNDTFDENDSVTEAALPGASVSNGDNVKPIMAVRSDHFGDAEIRPIAVSTNKPSFSAWAILMVLVLGFSWVIMSIIDPETSTEYKNEVMSMLSISQKSQMEQSEVATAIMMPALQNPIIDTAQIIASQPMVAKDEPETGVSKDIITTAKATDYFVQHMFFKEKEMAMIYLNNNPSLKDTALVVMSGPESEEYHLISGPFDTEQGARDFIQLPGVPKYSSIRDATQLKVLVRLGST